MAQRREGAHEDTVAEEEQLESRLKTAQRVLLDWLRLVIEEGKDEIQGELEAKAEPSHYRIPYVSRLIAFEVFEEVVLVIRVTVEYRDEDLIKRHEKHIVLDEKKESQQIYQGGLIVLRLAKSVEVINEQGEYHKQITKS